MFAWCTLITRASEYSEVATATLSGCHIVATRVSGLCVLGWPISVHTNTMQWLGPDAIRLEGCKQAECGTFT